MSNTMKLLLEKHKNEIEWTVCGLLVFGSYMGFSSGSALAGRVAWLFFFTAVLLFLAICYADDWNSQKKGKTLLMLFVGFPLVSLIVSAVGFLIGMLISKLLGISSMFNGISFSPAVFAAMALAQSVMLLLLNRLRKKNGLLIICAFFMALCVAGMQFAAEALEFRVIESGLLCFTLAFLSIVFVLLFLFGTGQRKTA